jgi:hypothetical protein
MRDTTDHVNPMDLVRELIAALVRAICDRAVRDKCSEDRLKAVYRRVLNGEPPKYMDPANPKTYEHFIFRDNARHYMPRAKDHAATLCEIKALHLTRVAAALKELKICQDELEIDGTLSSSWLSFLQQMIERCQATGVSPALGVSGKIHFDALMRRATHGFIGREWLVARLDTFIDKNPCGYFEVRGQPGIGKAAFVSSIVQSRGYVHHFNDSTQGIVSLRQFVRNFSARLIERYCPGTPQPDESQCQDGTYLQYLLDNISKGLKPGKKAALVIDSLERVPAGLNRRDSQGAYRWANLTALIRLFGRASRCRSHIPMICGSA